MSASKRTNCDYIEFFSELHESNFFLLNVFKNLLKFGQFDCILCVENRIYPVHKLVLASCSPFFSEFLFKFPNIVKLTLVFAHLKSSDVLQLLSFLYYGHAIISNHKKASIAKFKNLLDLLAINNFSFKESHDGRLILQSLHQTRFECPPNTITFDFNMYAAAAAGTAASKKEPHVVLSYDATFNLKSVLNNYSKNTGGKPTALIEGDENEDACFESCREEIVENTTDPCENENEDSEASDSERARDREHAYHTTNSNKPHRTHRRSPAESDGGDSGRRLLQHCNFDCDENMEPVGKDNFDIVDNEVIIETSNETSDDVMGDKQNANQYSSERVWKQCISYDRQQMKFDTTHSDTTGSTEPNGDHWKQIIRYRNDAACIDHDSSKLNVDFDVNFKPIVIENNARTNFSIVKTGKCVKNNCYVTVLEQEEYEETGRESKREIVVKENLTYTATVIDSTNIKQEFTRSDGTVKREGFTRSDGTVKREAYCSSPDRFGCFQRNNCEDAALGNTHVESNGKLVQHDVNSKRIEHPVGGPVNNSSPTETSSVQTRNNIELLIEASNVLLDINVHTMRSTPAAPSNVHTMRNTPAAAPSLTNTHSRVQNENKTNDVTQTGSKTSCSRPKRKQTLYKRSCDSDDADFYEPARDRNRKAAAAPYRKAVRRLDFNSFAYKRVKTESDANALSGNVGIQPLRSERHASASRNEIGNHRASVTSSSSGPFECYRRASVSSTVRNDRDSSGDERKLANREEVEPMSEEDDDSEATLSVEDFATSAECYDDVAREATLPFDRVKVEANNPPRLYEQFHDLDKQSFDLDKQSYDLDKQSYDIDKPSYDLEKAASVTTDQQLVKEYALSRLGLRSKLKTDPTPNQDDTTMETNVGDSVKSEDYKQNTTDSQDYKTDESRGATVPYCDKEEMMESTEDEEDNDNYSESDNDSKDNDNTGSEHDAGNDKENENYSFRNVYHQMKMIHSRPVVTNDEHNGGNQNQEQVDGNETQKNHSGYDEDKSNQDAVNGIEEQNKSSYDGGEDNDNGSSCDDSSNETEPGYVDNTDEDADYDPYYEEDGEESEDSEHHRVARHQDNVPRRTTAPKYSSCETEGTVYYCTPCNRRYHTKTGFSQHKRFECGKPPAFQCLICCKEFNRKSSLKRHLRQIHKTNLQVNVNCVVHHDKLSASLGSVVNHANQNYPPTVRRYAPRSVSSTSSSSGDERNKYNRPRAYCRQDTDNRSKYNRLSRPPYWREDSDNRPRTYCREDVRTLRHAVIRRHLFSTRV